MRNQSSLFPIALYFCRHWAAAFPDSTFRPKQDRWVDSNHRGCWLLHQCKPGGGEIPEKGREQRQLAFLFAVQHCFWFSSSREESGLWYSPFPENLLFILKAPTSPEVERSVLRKKNYHPTQFGSVQSEIEIWAFFWQNALFFKILISDFLS